MLYVFHGEDEFSRSEAITQLRRKMDPVVGDLNTTLLDGRSLRAVALRTACDVVPFLGDRRLVIVHDLFSASTGGNRPNRRREPGEAPGDEHLSRDLEAYLPRLPESTRLVLSESRSLPDSHLLLRVAEQCKGFVRHFAVPVGPGLDQWIAQRAQSKGVGIAPEATTLLAGYVGANLRLLDQELEKLATYLDGQGKIGRPEVERLVSAVQEANIFHLVDALGGRDCRRALQLLHRLLDEGQAPLYLLTMMTRQFRLLLQAREMDAQGLPAADMAPEMEVPPFIVRKTLQQAKNFRPGELKAILGQLLDIDVGIKTGQEDGPLALDLFVVRWTSR